ncbi:snare associated golgi, putative [Ichthyophthirius multifiliis]|uniref:Snare associated golgi, putative n=1 Tax=Ichthyophthirius multifiliis TaxID=5932 RepID=G0R1D3_ICHMU|nr:snare associated golgi, putative [Ichthyophthirius multifiliis]EGR28718.1 snare associated golgi, putative [Ichthyophthirius multifiliis]|eukprot:XP_004029954.1 snare associated golgi, putative [Ichthyophthirius multifiliis]
MIKNLIGHIQNILIIIILTVFNNLILQIVEKMVFWKFIPVIFLAWLGIQIGVLFYLNSVIPEFKNVGFPTSFEKAQIFSKIMSSNLDQNYYILLLFVASNFLFLQTWCIPGTFVFNLLGGALFGIQVGFPVCLAEIGEK